MTWNPSDKSAYVELSNNNRTATHIGGNTLDGVRSTATAQGAKRYLEIIVNEGGSSPYMSFGLANPNWSLTYVGQDINSWGYYEENGAKVANTVQFAYGAHWATNGIVVGMAYDPDAGSVWFSLNNVWQNSGNPETGANPAFTGLASNLYAAVGLYRTASPTHVITGNFVTAHLSYSPPSGFIAWDDTVSSMPIFVQTQPPHNSHIIARLGL